MSKVITTTVYNHYIQWRMRKERIETTQGRPLLGRRSPVHVQMHCLGQDYGGGYEGGDQRTA